MKKAVAKLTLTKETVKTLHARELAVVAGASVLASVCITQCCQTTGTGSYQPTYDGCGSTTGH